MFLFRYFAVLFQEKKWYYPVNTRKTKCFDWLTNALDFPY